MEAVNQIWNVVAPIVAIFVSVGGPILATWIVTKASAFLDIKNEDQKAAFEAKLRDALHQSALNALKLALLKAGIKDTASITDVKKVLADPGVVDSIKDYITEKNPDAITKLGVSELGLEDIAFSKIPEALAAIQSTAKPVSTPSK